MSDVKIAERIFIRLLWVLQSWSAGQNVWRLWAASPQHYYPFKCSRRAFHSTGYFFSIFIRLWQMQPCHLY